MGKERISLQTLLLYYYGCLFLVSEAEHVAEVGRLLGGQGSGRALAGAVTEISVVGVRRGTTAGDAVPSSRALVKGTRVVLEGIDVLSGGHVDGS